MKTRILLVEDDPALRKLLKDALPESIFVIDIAETGREGLDVIVKRKPDLILLDWNLPDLNGFEVCKYIKQNFIGMKCPQCKEGELVEKKARRGNFFYGCSEYPKCDFTSNWKPIDEKCPECGHPYLVEKILKSGPVIACPNKGGDEEEQPKRRRKKAAEGKPAVKCNYSRPVPTPAVVA